MRIRSRSDWDARAPRSSVYRPLSYWEGIRVHHSAGPSYTSIRSIQDYHMDNRGWPDIGYNHLIKNGQVWTGRGFYRHPAHDGINDTLGVCLVGTFTSSLPSAEDLQALVDYIRHARELTGRKLAVSGHRDVGPTACPGDTLYRHLPTIRTRAEGDDMPTVNEIWNHRDGGWYDEWITERWPSLREDGWRQTSLIQGAYAHARSGKEEVRRFGEEILEEMEASRQTQEAILAAVSGSSSQEILDTLHTQHQERKQLIEQGHTAEMQKLALLEQQMADLAELFEQFQSGGLAAEKVVNELGRRLASGSQ